VCVRERERERGSGRETVSLPGFCVALCFYPSVPYFKFRTNRPKFTKFNMNYMSLDAIPILYFSFLTICSNNMANARNCEVGAIITTRIIRSSTMHDNKSEKQSILFKFLLIM
jgi:hypothetical protein